MTPPSPVMPADSVVLNCAVQTPDGLSKPNIYWLNPQGRIEHKEKLEFKARSQHCGEWTCVIRQNNEKKITLSVSVAGELFRVNNNLFISNICIFNL